MYLVLQLKISEENCLNLAWDQTKSMLNSVCVCVALCQCVGLLMAVFSELLGGKRVLFKLHRPYFYLSVASSLSILRYFFHGLYALPSCCFK